MYTESIRKEILVAIKGKNYDEAISVVEKLFKSKEIQVSFNKIKIQNYKVFEISIKGKAIGFQCKHESFFIWNWWNVRTTHDTL